MRTRAPQLVTLLVAGALLTSPAVFSTSPQAGPGSPGLGDPYYPGFGNGGYDAKHYDLNLKYDAPSGVLTGVATMTASATADLTAFNLDMYELALDEVTVDGKPAKTARAGSELTITPTETLRTGQSFTVVSKYHGVPKLYSTPIGSSGFFRTKLGATVLGEPEAAASWFPDNDHPLDKATYSFAVTVPDGRTVITNGRPKGKESQGGWTTWRYEEDSPMASYLATMNIGDFELRVSDHKGMPMVLAADRATLSAKEQAAVLNKLEQTGPIIDFLATKFGPYPFSSAGGIATGREVPSLGALENQTRPIYTGYAAYDETIIAHEIAHQWYGDSVSLASWKDIWLNEGFATYAEWLYKEHKGTGTADSIFKNLYDRGATAGHWSPKPGDPSPQRLFSSAVYQRGAMTLHAVRRTIGDDHFFALLQRWASSRRNGNGTTEQFIALAEEISGKKLGELFQAWLYTTTKPAAPPLTVSERDLAMTRDYVERFTPREPGGR